VELLDRTTVRTFLATIAPREVRGVRLLVGGEELLCERTAPLPWQALEEAVSRGDAIRVRPVPDPQPGLEPRALSVWVHLPAGGRTPAAVASSLFPAVPALVCADGPSATVYWRIQPTPPEEAGAIMDALAALLEAAPGYPDELCTVPLTPDRLWADLPPTVWSHRTLLACAESVRARSAHQVRQQTQPAEQPPATPPPGDPWPEGWTPWEEAGKAAVDLEDRTACAILQALLEGEDVEAALQRLGIEAVGEVGGAFRVLRGGRWHRAVLRSVEIALAPETSDGVSHKAQVQGDHPVDVTGG